MIINNKQGQGLIELIIAVAVITTGLFSIWTLFVSNFNGEQEAKARVVGANLAREGLEAVKNVRDSNWLHNDENIISDDGLIWSWDNGLNAGNYVVTDLFTTSTDISYDGMAKLVSVSGVNDPATRLYVDGEGFFTHQQAANASAYSRTIVIKNICCDTAEANRQEDIIRLQCSNQNFQIANGDCDTDQAKVGIDVISRVDWQVEGKARNIVMQDQLFDWR